jgi:four helix bundle protein
VARFGLKAQSARAAGFSSRYRSNDFRVSIADFGLGKHEVNEELFKARTRKIALDIIGLIESLPRSRTADVIGRQLLRSGTSIGANYRAACRGKSTADVISKLGIVEEEGDETIYWLELLVESGIVSRAKVEELLKETDEIIAMTVASIKTLRERNGQLQNNRKSKNEFKTESKIE